ncbi:late embryogenesis abundant domain-containing protein / LEA domain-containing protein [Striga hermonthica]|uniref:Late embryogenesis abundant domain-containing protein / LEA domain-containing protein n=1 Tax=Striga hermonthica TaxID=68872 RepID=A0A9N7RFI3_STRHE|nr:late embryogenesis abundant domain-containing protein / LEA domain-containing protein [Striga hermonthica]
MMNALALGLVLTSLLTAGFFSPTPETRQQPSASDDVIVKDGHRVVVVEFEKDDGGHTKVLISPPEHESEITGKSEISEPMKSDENEEEEEAAPKFRPRELVCDAYGKCKHKIASAFEKTKEAVADKIHAVEDEAKQTVDKISEKSHELKEGAKKEGREIKEGAKKVKEKLEDEAKETKDKISEKSHEIKEAAKKESDEIKEGAKRVEEEVEGAREMAKAAKREGEKELGEIVRGVRQIGGDVFNYVFSRERWEPLFGILHLLGFASAYGTCVWVTFASSYVLAGSLPRGQFGVVQSRIYPVYFRAVAYSLGLAILGHVLMMGRAGLFHGFNLAGAFGIVLANMLYLEPRAAKVMVERMKREKEEGAGKEVATEPSSGGTRATGSIAETAGRGSLTAAENLGRKEKQHKNEEEEMAAKAELARLSEKLRGLNSYSSFLNVLTLMSLTWHLVHLGHRLHATCY